MSREGLGGVQQTGSGQKISIELTKLIAQVAAELDARVNLVGADILVEVELRQNQTIPVYLEVRGEGDDQMLTARAPIGPALWINDPDELLAENARLFYGAYAIEEDDLVVLANLPLQELTSHHVACCVEYLAWIAREARTHHCSDRSSGSERLRGRS